MKLTIDWHGLTGALCGSLFLGITVMALARHSAYGPVFWGAVTGALFVCYLARDFIAVFRTRRGPARSEYAAVACRPLLLHRR